MKKKIALALLVVALLVGGLAGGVYAVSHHQPVKGEKLIGVSGLGTTEIPGGTTSRYSFFRFTNTDCVNPITIAQVSIIRGDETVIYEGPFIRVTWDTSGDPPVREVITTPLTPHETRRIPLMHYRYIGGPLEDPSSWLSSYDAIFTQPFASYTVEIAWEAKGNVSPLTGWQRTTTQESAWGENFRMTAESQMVNMTQRAK